MSLTDVIPSVSLTREPESDDPTLGMEAYLVQGFVPALGESAAMVVYFSPKFVADAGLDMATHSAHHALVNWVTRQPEWSR